MLYLLRTIESGEGDRKEGREVETTRRKEARREHVIIPVTSALHLISLKVVVCRMDIRIAELKLGGRAGTI